MKYKGKVLNTFRRMTAKLNTCRNCGHIGHLYRDCLHPITSFGIICYRIKNKIEYLMIQRKDSLCFMEFVRGKYDIKDIDYMRHLLSGMTIDERMLLEDNTFDNLWNYVWYQPTIPKQTNEYTNAKLKFESLKKGIKNDLNININLKYLIDTSVSLHTAPEWGFPKGRRKMHEEDIRCACREFTEETGIFSNEIELESNLPSFEEIFYGTNNVLYRHVYYIAKMISNRKDEDIKVDPTNINQIREVREISWFSFEEAMIHIRDHNSERKNLFKQVHTKLSNRYEYLSC